MPALNDRWDEHGRTCALDEHSVQTPNRTIAAYQYLATSDAFLARCVRAIRRVLRQVSLPAPNLIFTPLLYLFLFLRYLYHGFLRVFVCEPLFKSYCSQYGRRLHTDCHIHWIQGKGKIIVGDDVRVGGKCDFFFAAKYSSEPALIIGDGSGIGHGCTFVIGKRITIGRNCQLSGDIWIADSNGHSTAPERRKSGMPPTPEEVRPVVIGDGVWIGRRSMIFPGVRVGEGSVIAAGAVVHSHVPPYSLVAGNPAKVVMRLRPARDPAADGPRAASGVEDAAAH